LPSGASRAATADHSYTQPSRAIPPHIADALIQKVEIYLRNSEGDHLSRTVVEHRRRIDKVCTRYIFTTLFLNLPLINNDRGSLL
jgi:hypothetical protein